LYGCETWPLTVREEHTLKVYDNRVLGRIFGSEREEVAGGWRTLHNEVLCNVYASPNIIRVSKSRRMGWTGGNTHGRDEKRFLSENLKEKITVVG
jgi:hypothetical protein